jgi:hypothetical protein
MPAVLLQRGTGEIRDSIAAVFRQHAYERALQDTLWQRFLEWARRVLGGGMDVLSRVPGIRWVALGLLSVLAVALIARAIYSLRRRPALAAAAAGRTADLLAGESDPWSLAERLAAAGRHTDAAHALYVASLRALERDERLQLHPSRTIGDYVRDLRMRSSLLFGRFREFARSYEFVVYGLGSCDRDRYERLRQLATPIVRPNA